MSTPVSRRLVLLGGAVATLLAVAGSLAALAVDGSGDHPVVGRFNITSPAGGAVWAFQPSGMLAVIGPGELLAEGSWIPAAGEGEFDARVDIPVTGQELLVLGQVSPDGAGIALYVEASDPQRPEDWVPWPAESRLVGERAGMTTEASPSPTPAPVDCARPEWVDGGVDWDRCDSPGEPAD